MTGKNSWTIAAAVLFAMALLGTTAPARAEKCSLAAAAGKYGFTLNGVAITQAGAVPLAAVGKAILDAAGNVSGSEARSVGGAYADETLSGTYTVNADCTGTATVQFFEAGNLVRTSLLSLVFDNNLREIRMVQKSLTLPNNVVLPVVITVEARKMFTEED